jgi:peptidoglycan/LPS O-acetylase OafA/YrhL
MDVRQAWCAGSDHFGVTMTEDTFLRMLIYVNMTLIVAVIVVYVMQIRKNHSPYGPLKRAMVACMVLAFVTYLNLLGPGNLFGVSDVWFVRISYSLLLLCLFGFGTVGLNRKGQ